MCGTAPITDPPAHANVLPRERIRGEIDITSPEHIPVSYTHLRAHET